MATEVNFQVFKDSYIKFEFKLYFNHLQGLEINLRAFISAN